jgi:hypothetical protein
MKVVRRQCDGYGMKIIRGIRVADDLRWIGRWRFADNFCPFLIVETLQRHTVFGGRMDWAQRTFN